MSDKTFKQTISLLRCSTTLVAASMDLLMQKIGFHAIVYFLIGTKQKIK